MTALVVAIKIVVKKARYKETALKISALELEMRYVCGINIIKLEIQRKERIISTSS